MLENLLDGFLTRSQLCKQLGCGLRTTQKWDRDGYGPPITKVGQKAYFRVDSVKEWLLRHEKQQPRDRSTDGKRSGAAPPSIKHRKRIHPPLRTSA